VVATAIARVQSSVKSQIAYASVAQIGLIFIEIAVGLDTIALFHFAGNAFMRTYQLLVSPSVVSYLIREQFYNFVPRPLTIEDSLPRKIENSIYILCLKEWNLDSFVYKIYWRPLKWIGRRLNFITIKSFYWGFVPLYLGGLFLAHHKLLIYPSFMNTLPVFFAFIGLIMVFKSYAEKTNVILSWLLVNMNHFWIAMAIAFNGDFSYNEVYLYLSGVVISALVGIYVLNYIDKHEPDFDLEHYHGHSVNHSRMGGVFLLACLASSGFPITPTFIGEDLMFSHIREDQYLLAFLVSLSFIVDGLSIIRIYARIFLGPHLKSQQEMAYKSS
jgi:NADH-quinone oxidoreductase subunit L